MSDAGEKARERGGRETEGEKLKRERGERRREKERERVKNRAKWAMRGWVGWKRRSPSISSSR